ncbi:MAG: carbohydrate ABC transporter permease, partial [Treponema sp.]|nr:carbohydrate ABC transporter permease [Treponema sp.]
MDDRSISPLAKTVIYFIMITFTVLAIYPLIWIFLQSFKTTQEYMSTSKLAFPKQWHTGNYPYVWKMGKFS